mmetsp:Transcript_13523/g.33149  ORF Transcript_13523/g.33149 Transcript_13523/m.33149 type:complete len:1398 (+) Transcript_13523:225-4418(+)
MEAREKRPSLRFKPVQPKEGFHKCREGDTARSLCEKFGCSLKQFIEENKLFHGKITSSSTFNGRFVKIPEANGAPPLKIRPKSYKRKTKQQQKTPTDDPKRTSSTKRKLGKGLCTNLHKRLSSCKPRRGHNQSLEQSSISTSRRQKVRAQINMALSKAVENKSESKNMDPISSAVEQAILDCTGGGDGYNAKLREVIQMLRLDRGLCKRLATRTLSPGVFVNKPDDYLPKRVMELRKSVKESLLRSRLKKRAAVDAFGRPVRLGDPGVYNMESTIDTGVIFEPPTQAISWLRRGKEEAKKAEGEIDDDSTVSEEGGNGVCEMAEFISNLSGGKNRRRKENAKIMAVRPGEKGGSGSRKLPTKRKNLNPNQHRPRKKLAKKNDDESIRDPRRVPGNRRKRILNVESEAPKEIQNKQTERAKLKIFATNTKTSFQQVQIKTKPRQGIANIHKQSLANQTAASCESGPDNRAPLENRTPTKAGSSAQKTESVKKKPRPLPLTLGSTNARIRKAIMHPPLPQQGDQSIEKSAVLVETVQKELQGSTVGKNVKSDGAKNGRTISSPSNQNGQTCNKATLHQSSSVELSIRKKRDLGKLKESADTKSPKRIEVSSLFDSPTSSSQASKRGDQATSQTISNSKKRPQQSTVNTYDTNGEAPVFSSKPQEQVSKYLISNTVEKEKEPLQGSTPNTDDTNVEALTLALSTKPQKHVPQNSTDLKSRKVSLGLSSVNQNVPQENSCFHSELSKPQVGKQCMIRKDDTKEIYARGESGKCKTHSSNNIVTFKSDFKLNQKSQNTQISSPPCRTAKTTRNRETALPQQSKHKDRAEDTEGKDMNIIKPVHESPGKNQYLPARGLNEENVAGVAQSSTGICTNNDAKLIGQVTEAEVLKDVTVKAKVESSKPSPVALVQKVNVQLRSTAPSNPWSNEEMNPESNLGRQYSDKLQLSVRDQPMEAQNFPRPDGVNLSATSPKNVSSSQKSDANILQYEVGNIMDDDTNSDSIENGIDSDMEVDDREVEDWCNAVQKSAMKYFQNQSKPTSAQSQLQTQQLQTESQPQEIQMCVSRNKRKANVDRVISNERQKKPRTASESQTSKNNKHGDKIIVVVLNKKIRRGNRKEKRQKFMYFEKMPFLRLCKAVCQKFKIHELELKLSATDGRTVKPSQSPFDFSNLIQQTNGELYLKLKAESVDRTIENHCPFDGMKLKEKSQRIHSFQKQDGKGPEIDAFTKAWINSGGSKSEGNPVWRGIVEAGDSGKFAFCGELLYGKKVNVKFIPENIKLQGWSPWREAFCLIKNGLNPKIEKRDVVVLALPMEEYFMENFSRDKAAYFRIQINERNLIKAFIFGPKLDMPAEKWEHELGQRIARPNCVSGDNMLLFAVFERSKPHQKKKAIIKREQQERSG